MPLEKSAGAVVFRKINKKRVYLLIQYGWGHWGFPRGNLVEGEDWKDAAVREITEETGISDLSFIPGFKTVTKFFYKKEGEAIFKVITFFLAQTSEEKVKLSFEHKDYKWLEYENALEHITHKESKEILKKAEEFLRVKEKYNQLSIINYQ